MTCGPATDHRNKKCVLTTKSLQTEAKGSGPCQGLDWPGGWSRLPPRPLRGRPRAAVSPSLQASLVLDKVHSPLLQFGSTCFAVTLFILWSVAGPQKSNSCFLQERTISFSARRSLRRAFKVHAKSELVLVHVHPRKCELVHR